MAEQTPKVTHLYDTHPDAAVLKGGAPWPPPSPWIWQDSWWTADMIQKDIILTWNFDDSFTGGGTLALTSLAYDLDPKCPWEWLIVVKPDGTRITQQIPRGSRTGTVTATQLAAKGLHTFTDIGSITAGVTPN